MQEMREGGGGCLFDVKHGDNLDDNLRDAVPGLRRQGASNKRNTTQFARETRQAAVTLATKSSSLKLKRSTLTSPL